MSRLVVVSNRVPLPGDRNPAAGGLAVGLADAVVPGSVWFGWSGRRAETTSTVANVVTARDITYATIDIGEKDYQRFYTGFANGALYPVLLYRLGLMAFRQDDYVGYRAVNRAFAEALMPILRSDDLVWVHDYQMLTVAHELRALGARQRIGFFLHTPFVPPAIFSVLPRGVELLRALCACDVIGFHTANYRDAFLQCVETLLGTPTNGEDGFIWNGRRVEVVVTPIGIDVDGFAAIAARTANSPTARGVVRGMSGRYLGVGVDRLDYAKGLPNRIQAFDLLFQNHPEHRRNVTFVQVVAPSREELADYRGLRRDLDRSVGDVNGRYSDIDWTPIRYMTRAISRPVLAGFYRAARLGIVTPLRDGMNLVAKEFVAAQDEADPGVLVLSRFAGAAEELRDALVVNPFDIEEISDALHAGLNMPLDERQARQRSMLAAIRRTSASRFCQSFMGALRGTSPPVRAPEPEEALPYA